MTLGSPPKRWANPERDACCRLIGEELRSYLGDYLGYGQAEIRPKRARGGVKRQGGGRLLLGEEIWMGEHIDVIPLNKAFFRNGVPLSF